MGYINGTMRGQSMLFPVSLDEYVGENNAVRAIAAFVEYLRIEELGFVRSEAAATGRPGYDPRVLLGVYIWGHLNGVRSSRRLERECGRNVELMYMTQGKLVRLIERERTAADRYLAELEEADLSDQGEEAELTAAELKQRIAGIGESLRQHDELLGEMKERGEKQISLTDQKCRDRNKTNGVELQLQKSDVYTRNRNDD